MYEIATALTVLCCVCVPACLCLCLCVCLCLCLWRQARPWNGCAPTRRTRCARTAHRCARARRYAHAAPWNRRTVLHAPSPHAHTHAHTPVQVKLDMLCQHGPDSKCLNCLPSASKVDKRKHLAYEEFLENRRARCEHSFNATCANCLPPSEVSYKLKPNCTKHKPWPHGSYCGDELTGQPAPCCL